MPQVLCDTTSLKIIGASRWDLLTAGAGEIVFEVATMPDRENQRWNGDTQAPALRAATAQELADATAEKNSAVSNVATNDPLVRLLADLFIDIEQRLRAAGQTSTISEIAAATNLATYRAALKTLYQSKL